MKNEANPEIDRKIKTLYESGLGIRDVARMVRVDPKRVIRALHRLGVKTRKAGSYTRTLSQRKKTAERMSKTHQQWLERDPEGYRRHQQAAAAVGARKGGLMTARLHPGHQVNIAREFHKNNPGHASKIGKLSAEKHPENGKKLGAWTKQHREYFRELAIKRHKEDPFLATKMANAAHKQHPSHWSAIAKRTHRENPDLASRMGKSTHQKHPELASITIRKTHAEWKKNNPVGYSERQAKAMSSRATPSKPESAVKKYLPSDFVFNETLKIGTFVRVPDFCSTNRKVIIQVDGPTHYKTLGRYYHNERLLKQQQRDAEETVVWNNAGYFVYRFKDFDIVTAPDNVLAEIEKIIKKHPLPR